MTIIFSQPLNIINANEKQIFLGFSLIKHTHDII